MQEDKLYYICVRRTQDEAQAAVRKAILLRKLVVSTVGKKIIF